MATITAEAKLYNGIRLLCVDVNAKGFWSDTFTLECDGLRVLRTACGIEAQADIGLVDERYLTYGGKMDGVVTASLGCKFPTYMRFDIEALGVPEGIDIILQMEEGFVIEGEYPDTERKPLPKVTNLMTFRTPKKGSLYPSVSTALSMPIERLRPFTANITDAMSFSFAGNYSPAGGVVMVFGNTAVNADAVKNAVFQSTMLNSVLMNTINTRLYFHDQTLALDNQVAINIQSDNSRVRLGNVLAITETNLGINEELYKNFTSDIVSTSSMSIQPVKTVRTITTEPVVASMNIQPIKIVQAQSSIQAQSTLEQNHDAVFTFYGNQWYDSMFINAFYEGQTAVTATIFWGDGTTTVFNGGNSGPIITHNYPSTQEWTIRIRSSQQVKGLFRAADNSYTSTGLRRIITLGQIGITSIDRMFGNCGNITEMPDVLPSTVTSMSYTFTNFKGGSSWTSRNHAIIGKRIENWDVSQVTDFSGCWEAGSDGAINYDEMDLRLWNTQSATTMNYMFYNTALNQDLSQWCVPGIPSTPTNFGGSRSTFTPLFQQPVWGTCP